MSVFYLAQPAFRWPVKDETVTMMPPSSAGFVATCVRPNYKRCDVISPTPQMAAKYQVLDIKQVNDPYWGVIGELTTRP